MSGDHTQGLLRAFELYAEPELRDNEGKLIAALPNGLPQASANARRLVACWNACDGIETELLRATGDGILRKSLKKTGELDTTLKATTTALQDLLKAAKRLEARGFFAATTCADKATNEDMLTMLQAIAKAEGGAQ